MLNKLIFISFIIFLISCKERYCLEDLKKMPEIDKSEFEEISCRIDTNLYSSYSCELKYLKAEDELIKKLDLLERPSAHFSWSSYFPHLTSLQSPIYESYQNGPGYSFLFTTNKRLYVIYRPKTPFN